MSAPNGKQHTALPVWQEWLYRNVALSLLIASEGAIIFLLVAQVSVPNLASPDTWSWNEWVLVSAGLGLAISIGGMALKLSIEMVSRFNEGRRISGLMILLGIFVFALTEVWCSIAERSTIVKPTPADKLLFTWLGIPVTPITFSVVFVALLLPFASIFTGFTLRPPQMEDAETFQARQERKLQAAQYQARIREAKARGLANAAGAAFQAVKQQVSPTESDSRPLDPLAADEMAEGSLMALNSPPDSDSKYGAPGGKGSRAPASQGLPRAMWTYKELRAWITSEFGYNLSTKDAMAAVRTLGNGRKAEKLPGQPYMAPASKCRQWARSQYWAQSIQLYAGDPDEEATG